MYKYEQPINESSINITQTKEELNHAFDEFFNKYTGDLVQK
jgi:hypothetical protein